MNPEERTRIAAGESEELPPPPRGTEPREDDENGAEAAAQAEPRTPSSDD